MKKKHWHKLKNLNHDLTFREALGIIFTIIGISIIAVGVAIILTQCGKPAMAEELTPDEKKELCTLRQYTALNVVLALENGFPIDIINFRWKTPGTPDEQEYREEWTKELKDEVKALYDHFPRDDPGWKEALAKKIGDACLANEHQVELKRKGRMQRTASSQYIVPEPDKPERCDHN